MWKVFEDTKGVLRIDKKDKQWSTKHYT